MKIIEIVRMVMEENSNNGDKAVANAARATAAIQGGIQSAAWRDYMQQYAETTDQLARLMGTDGTLNDPLHSRRRAYLAANAICAPGSTDQLDRLVDTIDDPPTA
jgi:hypothetical protein